MSDNFNWQKEDNTDWDEPIPETPTPLRANYRLRLKKGLPWLGLVLVILVIAGFTISAVLNRQVEQVENTARDDVVAAYNLVLQAALDKDFDIFSALVSDKDRDWKSLQKELLNVDLFISRWPFNLIVEREYAALQAISPTVILSPDLQTAEYTIQIPYQTAREESEDRTIKLEHTFFFLRQDEGWLLTPIPDDKSFWGSWNSTSYGDYFSLIYSDRDEQLANYLGVRFDELIGRICANDEMDCPSNFNLELRLDRNPSSLSRLNEYYVNLSLSSSQGAYHIALPSPTLIGRPLDEKGKEALFYGYADWIGGTIAARYNQQGFMTNEVELKNLMAQWELVPPPYPVQPLPIVEAVPPPPIPFPEQDVLYSCSDFSSLTLLRYNPGSNRWEGDRGQEEISQSLQFPSLFGSIMTAVPLDDGVLMSLFDSTDADNRFRLIYWHNGMQQIWLENQSSIQLLPSVIQAQFDPSGRFLVAYESFSVSDNNNFQISPYILDVQACMEGDCKMIDFGGFPFWSPDHSWQLILDPVTQSDLVLRNDETGEEIPLGVGFFPTWIDDTRFVYARNENLVGDVNEGLLSVETLIATVDDPLNPTLLVETADLAEAMSGGDSTIAVSVDFIVAHPDQPDWFFLSAALHPETDVEVHYIVAYRRDLDEVTVLQNLGEDSLTTPLQIYADGRYLSFGTFGQSNNGSQTLQFVRLIPLEPDEMVVGDNLEAYQLEAGFLFDWSLDGRWLLITEARDLRLVAPGTDYDVAIPHDFNNCFQATWVNSP